MSAIIFGSFKITRIHASVIKMVSQPGDRTLLTRFIKVLNGRVGLILLATHRRMIMVVTIGVLSVTNVRMIGLTVACGNEAEVHSTQVRVKVKRRHETTVLMHRGVLYYRVVPGR